MQTATFVMFALCVASSLAELPGCNQDVINSIKEHWAENGTPKKVMESLAKNGKGTLVYSTAEVPLTSVPVKKPKCVKGEFTKDTAKFSIVPKKGQELDASKATTSHEVTEKDGVISEDGGKVTKYIITNSEETGITTFYTCNPKSKANGEPSVGLAVAINKFAAATKEIKAAKSFLENFGFELVTSYGKDCAK